MSVQTVCYSALELEAANAAIERLMLRPEFSDGPFWVEPPAWAATPGHIAAAADFGKHDVRSVFWLEKDKFSPVRWDIGIAIVRAEFAEPSMLALLNNDHPR